MQRKCVFLRRKKEGRGHTQNTHSEETSWAEEDRLDGPEKQDLKDSYRLSEFPFSWGVEVRVDITQL